MVKRPKVDSEALHRILPDTESFASSQDPSDPVAQKPKDSGDLVQKITALKEMVDQLSGLLDSKAFKKLTCKDLP